MMENQLLTPDDVAEELQITRNRVTRLINSGDLPAIKVGQEWRIARAALRKWLAANSTPSSTGAA